VCHSGFRAYGDYLWVRPRRSEPAILQGFTTPLPPDGTTTFIGSSSTGYDTQHTPAFRAGADILYKDGFVFSGAYTRYKDLASSNIFANLDPTATASIQFVGPGVLGVTGTPNPSVIIPTWEIDYQTIDIMAGSVFRPGCAMEVLLNAGARLAYIDQTFTTTIDQTPFGLATTLGEQIRSSLRGAGPRVGSELHIYPPFAGVTLYARAYSSILLTNRVEESVLTLPGTSLRNRYQREEIIPNLEMAVGVELTLIENRLWVSGGYEFNYWWEVGSTYLQNVPGGVLTTNRHVDFSLDGAALRVTWMF